MFRGERHKCFAFNVDAQHFEPPHNGGTKIDCLKKAINFVENAIIPNGINVEQNLMPIQTLEEEVAELKWYVRD